MLQFFVSRVRKFVRHVPRSAANTTRTIVADVQRCVGLALKNAVLWRE